MTAAVTWVALLRGINVGKAKRVPMETLRQLLAGLGCTQVQTLLNSGNAVFSAPGPGSPARAAALAASIARAIQQRLGLEVPVIVKSARHWADIVHGNPFAEPSAAAIADPAQLLVAVMQDPARLPSLGALESLVVAPEGFCVGPAAAYLHCASGILQSKAGSALLGPLGQAVTTRNWNTTLKIQAALVSAGTGAS